MRYIQSQPLLICLSVISVFSSDLNLDTNQKRKTELSLPSVVRRREGECMHHPRVMFFYSFFERIFYI